MATNQVHMDGDNLSWAVPNGTLSGAPVRVGVYATGLNGVCQTKEFEGGNVDNSASVRTKGVWKVPVSTTTTLAVGDPVYITSANVLTPVSTSNKVWGIARTAKSATANELVDVLIVNPTA